MLFFENSLKSFSTYMTFTIVIFLLFLVVLLTQNEGVISWIVYYHYSTVIFRSLLRVRIISNSSNLSVGLKACVRPSIFQSISYASSHGDVINVTVWLLVWLVISYWLWWVRDVVIILPWFYPEISSRISWGLNTTTRSLLAIGLSIIHGWFILPYSGSARKRFLQIQVLIATRKAFITCALIENIISGSCSLILIETSQWYYSWILVYFLYIVIVIEIWIIFAINDFIVIATAATAFTALALIVVLFV